MAGELNHGFEEEYDEKCHELHISKKNLYTKHTIHALYISTLAWTMNNPNPKCIEKIPPENEEVTTNLKHP